jgi:hypothetical protein
VCSSVVRRGWGCRDRSGLGHAAVVHKDCLLHDQTGAQGQLGVCVCGGGGYGLGGLFFSLFNGWSSMLRVMPSGSGPLPRSVLLPAEPRAPCDHTSITQSSPSRMPPSHTRQIFDRIVLTVIVLNSIILAIQDPVGPPTAVRNQIGSNTEALFTALFTVELLIKVGCSGGWGGADALLFAPCPCSLLLRGDPPIWGSGLPRLPPR